MSFGGGASKYYRCGKCDINLKFESRWQRCPRCRTPCATLTGHRTTLLSDEEAERLTSYIKFERQLTEETEADRQERQARRTAKERERAERSARFEEVLRQGSFTPEDRRRYADLEARLIAV